MQLALERVMQAGKQPTDHTASEALHAGRNVLAHWTWISVDVGCFFWEHRHVPAGLGLVGDDLGMGSQPLLHEPDCST